MKKIIAVILSAAVLLGITGCKRIAVPEKPLSSDYEILSDVDGLNSKNGKNSKTADKNKENKNGDKSEKNESTNKSKKNESTDKNKKKENVNESDSSPNALWGANLSAYSGKNLNEATILIDTASLGKTIPNIVSNSNVWDMGTAFYNPTADEEVTKFTKYVQLMQATGGTASRDLFKNPYDTSTFTDYDFTKLIKNCRGILSLGMKPLIKLGGVPIKMSKNYKTGGFNMNVYPPDDYKVYYNYIKAITQALVDEFGKQEVLSWRFGCMTEYENRDWFMAPSGDPNDTAVAFCKLYDYTVQALIDVLGDTVFVGAHSMTVTEGLWDEAIFIRHVATGKNYATGKTGTRICYLSASFYDEKPGVYTSGKTLPKTIEYLKSTAEAAGLKNLIYGVDEGRILKGTTSGTSSPDLDSRTVGYTWQAAYDARLYKQGIDCGLDYFSTWGYLTNGLLKGFPTISYHVARNIYDFAGLKKAKTTVSLGSTVGATVDINCLAAYDEQKKVLRMMIYNYDNNLSYDETVKVNLTIDVPKFAGKTLSIIEKEVSDDCNFFDEWVQDRKTYNITDKAFLWSPDDGHLDTTRVLNDSAARLIYQNNLRNKYIECAKLIPRKVTQRVGNDGVIFIGIPVKANTVLFYEIGIK